MKLQERIAITRIFVDLIKADSIIDVGEMEMYAQIKTKYNITREIERDASDMSLEEAIRVLSNASESDRKLFLNECEEMTVSDGFCDSTEAAIVIGLRRCLDSSYSEHAEVVSVYEPDLKIATSQVIYVEEQFDEDINHQIKTRYRSIVNEFKVAGFSFVYIPNVARHYQQYNQTTFREVANFLAPTLSDDELETLVVHLCEMTTCQFCKEQLYGRLGMKSMLHMSPSILVKIGSDYVGQKLYGNFLRLEVGKDFVCFVQKVLAEYIDMLSSNMQVISNVEESQGRFLYQGFYKQLFDMYTIRQGVESTIEVNPLAGSIRFPEINRELPGLKRKEKAFYVMLLFLSKTGGVSFNQPTSPKQLASYKSRMEEVKSLYKRIYESFGGESDKVPDISLQNIRGPIVANIRSAVKKNQHELYNSDDYNIRKDKDGLFSVPLPSKLVKVLTAKGWKGLEESEL